MANVEEQNWKHRATWELIPDPPPVTPEAREPPPPAARGAPDSCR
jgi:hypothetical protein